jgi:hypothetical protein
MAVRSRTVNAIDARNPDFVRRRANGRGGDSLFAAASRACREPRAAVRGHQARQARPPDLASQHSNRSKLRERGAEGQLGAETQRTRGMPRNSEAPRASSRRARQRRARRGANAVCETYGAIASMDNLTFSLKSSRLVIEVRPCLDLQ